MDILIRNISHADMVGLDKYFDVTELPEHGRQIDADALVKWFIERYDLQADLKVCHVIAIIADPYCAPTIIPANRPDHG